MFVASKTSHPMKLFLRPLAVALLLIFPFIIAQACAGDNEETDGRLRVVSSVAPITSLVENVGGSRIVLVGVIPEGVNSHTYDPAPSVARSLADADLIILNGLFLEEPFLELAEASKQDEAEILTLADKAITRDQWVFDFSFPAEGGNPNPHLWTAPLLALRYAEIVRDRLSVLDPDNAAYYTENYEKLKIRIQDLDGRIEAAVDTIPPRNRKLLTYHDSFPFFAPRYGMEIIGAIQPSDFSQPSAREMAGLIDQVRDSGVPAIFGSEVFPSDVMEQIASESGANFVDQLRDDDLPGAPGDPLHSYLGMMLTNARIIVSALGGDPSALEGFNASHVFEGESGAVYPQ